MLTATFLALMPLLAQTSSAPAVSTAMAQGAIADVTVFDTTVEALMQTELVPGLGIAIIRDGKVASVKAYGQRDLEKKLPLTGDTIMYGASLTKATFAYLVMQLVDEGKMDLDKPIGGYLPKPLPKYPRYAVSDGACSKPRAVTPSSRKDTTRGRPTTCCAWSRSALASSCLRTTCARSASSSRSCAGCSAR